MARDNLTESEKDLMQRLSSAPEDERDEVVLKIWQRYADRLVEQVRRRLNTSFPRYRRSFSASDVVQSVARSIWEKPGSFAPKESLWRYLLIRVERNLLNKVRDLTTLKRGFGRIDARADPAAVAAPWPPVEDVAGMEDLVQRLLDELEKQDNRHDLQSILMLWIEGHTDEEIADILGMGPKTVQRRRQQIEEIARRLDPDN